jgi:hypothetical protein
MSQRIDFPDGGYSFVKGGFPYSQGVRASTGYAIERVRFAQPVALAAGFKAIERHLASIGRPRTALCAAELRSPKPLSPAGFGRFNEGYVEVLKQWGLYRDNLNPVARSNVAPAIDPPGEPCFYAFCYTVEQTRAAPSFVVAGSGESPDSGRLPEDIIARGDVSPAGMRAKTRFVLDRMDARLAGVGGSWSEASAVQVYCVHDIHGVLAADILPRSGNGAGTVWHYCRPPIEELEFEMDVRAVAAERVVKP